MNATFQNASKHVLRICCAFLLIASLGLGLTACSSDSTPDNATNDQDNASQSLGEIELSIDTTSIEGGEVTTKQVVADEGDTVIDVLEKSGIESVIEDSSYGAYVFSIEGLAQGDHGAMSGWLYSVNGQPGEEAADKYEVKKGDTITWNYSTEE